MRHDQHNPAMPLLNGPFAGFRRTTPALGTALALCAAVGIAGCKKDDPEAGKTESAQAQTSEKVAEETAKPAETSSTGKPTTADGLTPATQLQRGSVLGHVLLPHASGFLGEIKNQAAPRSTGMFLDEQMLRNLVSGQLGTRSNIAKNVDLAKPMGCALVDLTVTDMPLACIVGYAGGTDAIVGDLGEEGKQADAAGHAAHYKLGGQDIFVDALNDHVVLTNHTEVFGAAKEYLQSNMIGRADKVISDIEAVAYMSGVLTRYDKLLQPIVDQLTEAQSVTVGGNRFSEAMAKYNAKSTQDMVGRLADMEQITVGFGFEPAGFVLRYAVFPTAGSRLAEESKAAAAGSLEPRIVEHLPKSAWMLVGMSVDWATLTKTETAKEFRKVMGDAYAAAVEKDPAVVNQAIERYVEEMTDFYGKDIAYAVMHEPDTVGALLVSMQVQAGKQGRDQWKAWTEQFTPENVLDEETRKKLTWSFEVGAYEAGGVAIDRWVLEPTAAGHKELQNELGPQLAQLEQKLGGLRVVVDRAELDDRVLWLITPADEQKSMTAAIAAAKGEGSLAGDPGLAEVLTRSAGLSGLFAADVRRGADWLRQVFPADIGSRIPPNLGNTLSDVYMATSYAQSGTQTGEFVVSQPFIDQVRALAD